MNEVTGKVDSLQKTLDTFISSMDVGLNKLQAIQIATQLSIQESSRELKQSLAESSKRMEESNRELKQSLETSNRELKQSLAESGKRMEKSNRELKQNIEVSNEQLKRNMEKSSRELNQRIGNLSNRLGTIVEDMVLPSMPEIIFEKFGYRLERFFINFKAEIDGKNKEYDAVGTYKDYVFVNSTKSQLLEKHISEFIEDLTEFRDWFPEYKDKKLIGIFAAITLDRGVVAKCEKEGFLVMGIGRYLMELMNTEGFMPKWY